MADLELKLKNGWTLKAQLTERTETAAGLGTPRTKTRTELTFMLSAGADATPVQIASSEAHTLLLMSDRS